MVDPNGTPETAAAPAEAVPQQAPESKKVGCPKCGRPGVDGRHISKCKGASMNPLNAAPKRRGRPPKSANAPTGKRRGRPPKVQSNGKVASPAAALRAEAARLQAKAAELLRLAEATEKALA